MKPNKLNALTSLRFFAAAMIVFHHSFTEFEFGSQVPKYFTLNQAVSFFFILSGFILAYVYRSLKDKKSIIQFFIARIARVWPLHVTMLMLSIIISFDWYLAQMGHDQAIKTFWGPLFTNLFMLQSWVPLKNYFWSFNSVSWSISTEFGFYLFFPLIIYQFEKTWKFKLLGTLLISLSIIGVCRFMQLPVGLGNHPGYFGFLAINPLFKLFEFTFGVAMAHLYFIIKPKYQFSRLTSSALELFFFFLIIVCMYSTSYLRWELVLPTLGDAPAHWIADGAFNIPSIGFFIVLMALGKGILSEWLSRPALVLLGEISFSIYLLHELLIRLYTNYFKDSFQYSWWIQYLYFWIILLLGSYLLWQLVEKPCRHLILRLSGNTPPRFVFSEVFQGLSKQRIFFPLIFLFLTIIPLLI